MTARGTPGSGPLRRQLDEARGAASMPTMTVLSKARDPYRLDTPRNHEEGQWLAEQIERIGRDQIHIRGVHYATLGERKPDGTKYANTDKDYDFMNRAVKAARWLGYVDPDRISDERNAAPVVRIFERPAPWAMTGVGTPQIEETSVPEPRISLAGFRGVQPYRLVLFGEKVSLEPMLGLLSDEYEADLFLPSGEASDTLVWQMARAAAEDGRPLRCFYFSDCDPSGYEMSANVARKLQAFKTAHLPELSFEVRQVALTPDQVREYDLPITPLKKGDDRWEEATGVQQTEIDAIATLRPDLLEQLARQALDAFIDPDLSRRAAEVRAQWEREANRALDDDRARLSLMRYQAQKALEEAQDGLEELDGELNSVLEDAELPEVPEVPRGVAPGDGEPLISSEWSWEDQTLALKRHKRYGEDS